MQNWRSLEQERDLSSCPFIYFIFTRNNHLTLLKNEKGESLTLRISLHNIERRN